MKFDIEILNPVQRKIWVEVPGDTVKEEFARTYGNLSQRTRIKGFRPGKVPRQVLQRICGDEAKGRALASLVEHALRQVVRERGLQVVSRPEVEPGDLVDGNPFSFSAVVEVKPEVEVKDYSGLEVERIKLQIEDGQIDEALHNLQEAHAQLQPVEDRDVVQKHDFVEVDFVGTINNKPFPGNKGENYLLQVDGGRALPQFEEALVGLKAGMDHPITLTFPTDHPNPQLAGKEANFQVRVKEIKAKVLPPLDDEFAKDYGECGSLKELRNQVRKRLESELGEIQTRELKEQLLSRLIDCHQFEVPGSMVDQQLRYLIERRQRGTGGPGASGDSPSQTIEELRKELEPQARRQVRGMLLVENIAGREGITVSGGDVQKRIDELVRSAKEQGVALRDYYKREEARQELRSRLTFERTLDFLLERAKVREVDPAEASPSAKSKVDDH